MFGRVVTSTVDLEIEDLTMFLTQVQNLRIL